MIIIEERLKELFATLPAIVGDNGSDYFPRYDFGTTEDLVRYLKDLNKQKEAGKSVKKYPLVWLETPIKQKGDESPVFIDLKLILATESNSIASNTTRLEETFKGTLFPLLVNIKKSFRLSGFSRIMQPENNIETKFYNYKGKDIGTTDIWDAIKFECSLRITDCPQNNINY